MGTSSSGGKRDRFHRGVSKEKFQALAGKGLTQASGSNVGTDFDQNIQGAFEKFKGRNFFGSNDKRTEAQRAKDRARTEEQRLAHEKRREEFFQKISTKELDTLLTTFKQRQSSLTQQSQIQGRTQLILTDR